MELLPAEPPWGHSGQVQPPTAGGLLGLGEVRAPRAVWSWGFWERRLWLGSANPRPHAPPISPSGHWEGGMGVVVSGDFSQAQVLGLRRGKVVCEGSCPGTCSYGKPAAVSHTPPRELGFSGSPQALSTPGPTPWAPGAPGAVAHMGSGRHVFLSWEELSCLSSQHCPILQKGTLRHSGVSTSPWVCPTPSAERHSEPGQAAPPRGGSFRARREDALASSRPTPAPASGGSSA